MLSVAFFLGFITLFYFWMKWNYTFWKRKNVRGPKPSIIVGNIGSRFTFSRHWADVTGDWYNEYADEPYVGYYKMLQPAVLARDPDLIKDILISDFNKFRDNDCKFSKKQDPLKVSSLFFLKGDEWKESRKWISPVFSHTKMKAIYPSMKTSGELLIDYIESFSSDFDFNAKELGFRFLCENIIRCTFSINPECFNNEKESDFLLAGKTLFVPTYLAGLRFQAMRVLPQWAMDFFPVPFTPHSIDRLFRELVGRNKAIRSEDAENNDIFEALLHSQKKHNFNDEFLAGSSLSIFVEGTITSSSILSYVIYELAINPRCQDKIREEIAAIRSKYEGPITYEGMQEMNYVECVLFESIRIHPVVTVMHKVCTQEYTLPKTNDQSKPVTIPPGTVVNIPVLAIHRDSKYYPNPEEFKPERFFEEERRNRHMATFLGFGKGPRICPGMRFAILETKVILSHIVERFLIKLSPNQKSIVQYPQSPFSHPKDASILIRLEPC